MTTFPRAPAQKVPHQVAETARQVTRAHARLDQDESTLSQQASQIAAAATAISAVNTGTGGTTQENFLGSLTQVPVVTQADGGGWTAGGAINGSSQIDTTVLTNWMNAVHLDIQNLIAALHNSKLST